MKNIIYKIRNFIPIKKHEFHGGNTKEESLPEIFTERDVFGLEKPKAVSTISNNKPYKLFIGIALVFLAIFIAYLISI